MSYKIFDNSTVSKHDTYKILFMCLGNICRSPMAETITQKIINERHLMFDFSVDSAGLIRYHEGEKADPRMRMHAKARGYNITHLSRPITEDDFREFNLIVAMDDSVYDRLRDMAPGIDEEKKVVRMTDYCRTMAADHVPDPYYGGAEGFENVINILEDACVGLIDQLEKDI